MSIPRKRLKKKTSLPGDLPRVKRQVPRWVKEAADRAEARAKSGKPLVRERPDYTPEDLADVPVDKYILDEVKPKRRRLLGKVPVPRKHSYSRTPSTTRVLRLASTYDPDYHPKVAAEMIANGAFERDLCVKFGITKPVLDLWMAQYPEFAAACVITREASLADHRVERSVYEMANGYTVPETKVFVHKGEVIKVNIDKFIPKDINAAKYWLMNRDPTKWGKGTDSNTNSDALPAININMIRGMSTEQLKHTMEVLKQIMSPQQALGRLDEDMKSINDEPEVVDAEFTEEKKDDA